MINEIVTPRTITATTMSQDNDTDSCNAITTPPIIMIGAAIISVAPISTTICTCWTSLVPRVMRVGAPKRFTSRAENSPTRANNEPRVSRP